MADDPEGSSIGDSIAQLLKQVGIAPTETQDAVRAAVEAELSARGHIARIVEIRWNTLVLETDQAGAGQLTWDRDALVAALEKRTDGAIDRIQVRVKTRPDSPS